MCCPFAGQISSAPSCPVLCALQEGVLPFRAGHSQHSTSGKGLAGGQSQDNTPSFFGC